MATTTDPATVRAMNCATDRPDDDALPLPELAVRLCAGAVAISAATGAWLLLVAEFDRREGWAVPGVTSCAQWLSWQCGMAPGTARDHVRTARALPGLPGTARELSAGRISYAKARAEGLGLRCDVGLAERAERLILVLVGTLLAGLGVEVALAVALWLLAVASAITVVQRLLEARRQAALADS